MGWMITESVTEFGTAAGGFLDRRPVEYSVLRTVSGTLRRRGADAYGPQAPRFGWWREEDGGEVAAAFLCTPPYPPLLARGPERALHELAAAWEGPLAGARGDAEAVRAFGAAWQERTGAGLRVEREQRLHRLGTLTPRTPAPPGRARVAGRDDLGLLVRWHEEFARDIGESTPGVARVLEDALGYGGRTLWEVDGEPVAMAGHTSPEDGALRIVAVYTPAELRGRGYAGAVTAAVSRAALDTGARDVLLATDLANPVSNHLYRRLGYLPVRDQLSVAFT
ncbi:FR47-like protein [Actinacidiphila yanglinensis]|uniref:FR47-like protein n=1 Tax=Actinacidiphila yanglinensis TaxID=310779 RepID=A0A1H5Y2D7_9ACTN|nr:GNAT family N-acetyltransferase [Actinacidiphila yanglinensis]SEG17955.1 FR47-like protein [Actinacidiphila yanglinensis]